LAASDTDIDGADTDKSLLRKPKELWSCSDISSNMMKMTSISWIWTLQFQNLKKKKKNQGTNN